jgi:predicted RNase H-like HicB family nuclease
MALAYRARITPEGRAWLVEFPDCPGCLTFGDSPELARAAAREALEGWLEASIELGARPPEPASQGGDPVVVSVELEAALRRRWAVPG